MSEKFSALEQVVRPLFERDLSQMSSSENTTRDSDGKYLDQKIQAMWSGYALASAVNWPLKLLSFSIVRKVNQREDVNE